MICSQWDPGQELFFLQEDGLFVHYSQTFTKVRLDRKSVAWIWAKWTDPSFGSDASPWPYQQPALAHCAIQLRMSLGPVVTEAMCMCLREDSGIPGDPWPARSIPSDLYRTAPRGRQTIAGLFQVCRENKHNFLHGWQRGVERKEPHLWKILFLAALWNEKLL